MNSEPVSPKAEIINASVELLKSVKRKLAVWLEPENLEGLRPQLRFQTGVLAGFAMAASIILGTADVVTHDVIKLRLEEDLKASLAEVVPAELYDNDLLADTVTIDSTGANIGSEQTLVYLAKKEGVLTAACFKFVAPDGYAGPIYLVMGVNTQGEILGVRVISHVETPGLGDKIEISKSKWILSFNGKSLNNLAIEQWAVKKDGGVFDQFAGATITPRKVVQAIKRGLEFYQTHQADLININPVEE